MDCCYVGVLRVLGVGIAVLLAVNCVGVLAVLIVVLDNGGPWVCAWFCSFSCGCFGCVWFPVRCYSCWLSCFDCAGCPLVFGFGDGFGFVGWLLVFRLCCLLVRCIYCRLVLALAVGVWAVLYLLEVSLCLWFVSYCL